MQKVRRPRGGDASQQNVAQEQAPAQGELSNEAMIALMELAGEQAGVEEERTILQLSMDGGRYDFAEDGGKYDFAEDDDEEERRQQEDDLPGLREEHKDEKYEDYVNGQAFLQGQGDEHDVDPNDVYQGSLGDCYLMAGMAAVARANPEAIENLIHDNQDGTFEVTLYIRPNWWSDPEPVTRTIDARLASSRAGSPLYAKQGDKVDGEEELWAALLEKAVAQEKGSYEEISGGNIAKDGFEFHGAMELLTGEEEGYMRTSELDEDDVLLHICLALEDKKPVTVDSKNMKDEQDLESDARKYNVYGNHAYVPVSVDLGARTLDLQNPWGSHHVDDLPVADFKRFYRSVRIGA